MSDQTTSPAPEEPKGTVHHTRMARADDCIEPSPSLKEAIKAKEELEKCKAENDRLRAASQLIMKSFAYPPGHGPEWYEAARLALLPAETPDHD